MKKSSLILLIVCAGFSLSSPARAATLYFSPDKGDYQPGETASLELRLDNQAECVNAAEINISYPPEKVEVVDISRGESIFSIWVVAPTVKKDYGLITMTGGIPGGYCGRTPGDPAMTNIIAKIIVRFSDKIIATNLPVSAAIKTLDSSRVLLNNGRGTEAKLATKSANFSVFLTGKPQKNEWTEALQADKTQPEEFAVNVYRDRLIFDNKYFAVFSAQDKQTGIDHYEILEAKSKREIDNPKSAWKTADSPYPLKDQDLRSYVGVKAYDKAGNSRLAVYEPPQPFRKAFDVNVLWAIAGVGLVFMLIRFFKFIPW